MKRQWFKVELLSQVAIGSGNTLQGPAMSLNYLAGNLFLGTAAARLYPDKSMSQSEKYELFHSAAVRFSDAWPLAPSGEPAWPLPLSWHGEKGTEFKENKPIRPEEVENLLIGKQQKAVKSLKDGYVSRFGEYVKPATSMRLKTAIDARTGWSAPEKLFGYASLERGLSFAFFIEADDGLNPDLWARLIEIFQGEHRLGRSRFAEYGRTLIEPINPPNTWKCAESGNGLTHIWLLSDMAVEDEWGTPCDLPKPQWLGLPHGEPVPKLCFTAHRRDAPYNGQYRAHESERLLISHGSVLTFRLEQPVEDRETRPVRWGGLFQQCGLGCFWIDPPLLVTDPIPFAVLPKPLKSSGESKKAEEPDHPLAAWLRERLDEDTRDREERRLAEQWYRDLKNRYRSARTLAGVGPDVSIGPSPSQWGRIRDLARNRDRMEKARDQTAKEMPDLYAALFEIEGAPCGEKDPDWNCQILDETLQKENQSPPTFRDWLRHKLETVDAKQTNPARVLAYLARFAADAAKVRREQEVYHDA